MSKPPSNQRQEKPKPVCSLCQVRAPKKGSSMCADCASRTDKLFKDTKKKKPKE